MKQLLFSLISIGARVLIKIKKPYIIGVTATAGKTTMTHFIANFLQRTYGEKSVYVSPYSYNGEYGLPLAVIGVKNPDKNIFLWVQTLCILLIRLFQKYPKYLILEYGIDHPGEMDLLLSIATPDIAIIGPISPNHIEQFGTFECYRREKLKLSQQAKHVIAFGDHKKFISDDVVYYSLGAMSDIDASDIIQKPDSLEAIVHYQGKDYPIKASLFGTYQILNILPLFALGSILNIDTRFLVESIPFLHSLSGRSNLLRGINETMIIDGSYNGGFLSITESLSTIISFPSEYSIVLFLGDMRELGILTESLHRDLAGYINSTFIGPKFPKIILVGESMKQYVLPHILSHFEIFHSYSSHSAGEYIHNILLDTPGKKIVFVKGSQNTIFLEEGIKKFLDPTEDPTSLCRQSLKWLKIKKAFFQTIEK